MDKKGGRYTVDINGRIYSGRGEATINGNRVSLAAGANADGTGYSTVQAKLATLALTFDRGGVEDRIIWSDDMLLASINVTFTEDDVGIQHLYTGASWVGEGASINTASGEVTGMEVQSDKYQAIRLQT